MKTDQNLEIKKYEFNELIVNHSGNDFMVINKDSSKLRVFMCYDFRPEKLKERILSDMLFFRASGKKIDKTCISFEGPNTNYYNAILKKINEEIFS